MRHPPGGSGVLSFSTITKLSSASVKCLSRSWAVNVSRSRQRACDYDCVLRASFPWASRLPFTEPSREPRCQQPIELDPIDDRRCFVVLYTHVLLLCLNGSTPPADTLCRLCRQYRFFSKQPALHLGKLIDLSPGVYRSFARASVASWGKVCLFILCLYRLISTPPRCSSTGAT